MFKGKVTQTPPLSTPLLYYTNGGDDGDAVEQGTAEIPLGHGLLLVVVPVVALGLHLKKPFSKILNFKISNFKTRTGFSDIRCHFRLGKKLAVTELYNSATGYPVQP